MKKTLAFLLALAMVMALAACGGEDTPPAETDGENTTPVESPEGSGAPVATEVMGVTVPAFTIMVNDVEVTNETMADYPVYEVQTTTVNSAGTESTSTYTGFALSDVLTAAGISEYTTVQAVADDGYAVEVDAQVAAEPTTLVAVAQNGAQFTTSPWFAPCSSGTTGDYLKGMVALSVDGAEVQMPSAGGGEEEGTAEGLPEIMDRTDKVEFAAYSFLVNGETVTNDTLEGLSIYKIDAVTVNSAGESATSTYTGYRLSDVLNACGVTGYTKVTAVANDGYETEFDAATADSEYTLVAIEKDKETGEDGTIWVAPCMETSSKQYCKLVVEITAE